MQPFILSWASHFLLLLGVSLSWLTVKIMHIEQDSDFMGIYKNSVDNFNSPLVQCHSFLLWCGQHFHGELFLSWAQSEIFFPGPNMEKHFKRCLCLLFFTLVPEHAPRFGQTSHWPQANGAELMLYFLITVCLPDTGSQLWAGGLCALRVLKYFVSNLKDEVTSLVYTTRKTAGSVPLLLPWRLPFWITYLFLGKIFSWHGWIQDCSH